MADNKKSVNLLPEFLRTDKNSKFLASTIDQLIQKPQVERIEGFVGSKLTPTYNPLTDSYLDNSSSLRNQYSLEPALILKDSINNVTDAIAYDDLINELRNHGNLGTSLDDLFRAKTHSYDPPIDWDKLINYTDYCWLPNGPDPISLPLEDSASKNPSQYLIGQRTWTMPNGYTLRNGLKVEFYNNTEYVSDSVYLDKHFYVEGVGISIRLIPVESLTSFGKTTAIFNEAYDTTRFDDYGFDGDRVVPEIPEYITINRSSIDKNPWSQYNRWFHKDVVRITNEINKLPNIINADSRAQRPIIEFRAHLNLYNYGTLGIPNVDLIDDTTKDALSEVHDSYGYYVDGVELQEGNRVIFNADDDFKVRSRVYKVTFDYSGPIPILQLVNDSYSISRNQIPIPGFNAQQVFPEDINFIEDDPISVQPGEPINYSNTNHNSDYWPFSKIYSVNVLSGSKFNNTAWHYDNKNYVWVYSQQRTKLNQPPLFDLFTSDFVSYTKINDSNNFVGNKVFGYDIGTGANDRILGFPLKYQSNGKSYLFKNYFMTDTISITQNNIASSVSTSITFLRYTIEFGGLAGRFDQGYDYRGDKYINVWADPITHRIPIIETQTIAKNTTSITLTCLDVPINIRDLSISVFINNIKIPVTISASATGVTIINSSTFFANDIVILKIFTGQAPNDQGVYAGPYTPAQLPNKNGYYETPLGLTNNPFNEVFENLTLGELRDHVRSMINNAPDTIYSVSSITGGIALPRTLADMDPNIYTKYGSRLITNETPLAFAQLFFGKKEYNVVDAIRQAGVDYENFKLKLINVISTVIDSNLPSSEALDLALTVINADKDEYAPYRLSDMIPYGNNKILRTFKITDVQITTFDIGFTYDPDKLSFQSILVYLNGKQLLGRRKNYYFENNTIVISQKLRVDDVLQIHCYLDTRGCYIPATPSKLGMYMIHSPQFTTDVNGALVIKGHDASEILGFNDYRDEILLEYEKRVYNNIADGLWKESRAYYLPEKFPGLWKVKPYTRTDLYRIMSADFYGWCGRWSVDSRKNITSNIDKSKTWNYAGSRLQVFPGGQNITNINEVITPSKLMHWMYNTDSPGTTPWHILGLSGQEPDWWQDVYGPPPYLPSNTLLWTDITNGYVRDPALYHRGPDTPVLQPGYYTTAEWKRPGLYPNYIPVKADGSEIDWKDLLIPDTATDVLGEWQFGDNGPADSVWTHSSNYPFAICAAMAVLDPVAFCATRYDVSRSSINYTDQLVYNDDFLNLKKIIIDGEDDAQIAGFGVYIAEYGLRFDKNFISKFRQDINYLDSNLFHKLGGFVSKDKLQIKIDSIDPKSTSPGVILPAEDYSLILNVSNPINNATISGIVIQRYFGKFKIKGYDIKNSYFEVFKPIKISTSGAVKVGGVSEEFTDWSNVANNSNKGLSSVDLTSASAGTTRYYKQGQLVRNNNRFYRVKVGHNAESTFDASLYEPLSELPVKGGASVQASNTFENTVTKIPYGTTLSSIQEVYDIIIGYGAFLESRGFIFDDYNADLNEILNWKLSGKEFLYWTTQNFADGNLITLSPFAHSLKYNYPNSVVDNITSSYNLLKADGKPYPIDRFTMAREDTVCTIKTTDPNEGLFFASLASIQKEHAMILKNYTVFNDTIYDKPTGYKQQRIKLSGFRTKKWNGDLFSPGFVFDNVNVTDWQSYKQYQAGTVVRYNGKYYQSLVKIDSTDIFNFNKWTQLPNKPTSKLLPNFDYKVDQFEDFYSLDIDNFDSSQQELAQHLTGYTPRSYLNNIFTNPISQYKFYQGFIKDKGTKNAFDKLSKAGQFSNRGQLSFKEEWAFRIGHYGSFETFKELEFTLSEGTSLENPYLVKFVDEVPSDFNPLINYIATPDLLLSSDDYSASNAMPSVKGTLNDNNIILTTAGYVRLDDVTTTAYSKNSLLDIANNEMIQDGYTVWMGFLEDGNWAVYRYTKQLSKVTGVFVSAPTSEITFVTDGHHNLNIGDIISVVRFNEQVNGVYVVTSIPSINQFAVASSLASIENAELVNYGGLYRFENARYPNLKSLSEITDLLKLNPGDKVWIDSGIDNKWQVYEKVKNYNPIIVDTVDSPLDQEFGTSIWASDNSKVMLVSSPAWHTTNAYGYGRVKVYNQIKDSWVRQYDYILNSNDKIYTDPLNNSNFGYSIQYDIGKQLYITGAPLASSISSHSTGTGTVILSTGTGVAKSWTNEGLVQILSRTEDHNKIDANIVLVNPYGQLTTTATNSKFGFSIGINQVAANVATTLLVGAPGSSTGYVFAYKLNLTTSTNATATIQGFAHPTNVLSVRPPNTISLTNGNYWGHKIVGSVRGFAISAPGYNSSTGVVQTYNNNLQPQQTITSPFGLNGKFGHDIAISNDASYMLISAPYAKNSNEPYGNVAIYRNSGSLANYLASRAEVILALAAEKLAPVYYGEITILNWMTAGLSGFTNFWLTFRSSNPDLAANYDAERAADAIITSGNNAGKPIIESRARVISAYQNHPDAQLYPDEASIRYWMENGLGTLYNVLTSRQLANGLGGARRSTDTEYGLEAVTLPYLWNDFMNNYAVWNADGSPNLNFTTSVTFNQSGIYIFELAADNIAVLWIVNSIFNETQILDSTDFATTVRREVYVAQGTWQIRVAAYNSGGPAGVAFTITSDIAFGNTDTSIFDTSVVYNNILYPEIYNRNVAERSAVSATWRLDQIIPNPLSASDLKFGYSVSISKDNNTIGIGALGKNRSKTQVFDKNSNIGQTNFDNGSTKFYDSIPDGGTVYLYNKVGDKFIQADELNDVDIVTGSKYGTSLVVTNDNVFVGAPAPDVIANIDQSRFYIFNKIDTTSQSWKLLRSQEDTVDVGVINRVSLIDTVKEEIIEYLDVIDPVKGKIAGIADQELKYKTAFDPAVYTIGFASTIVDSSTSWVDDHIGELWWDLSTAKFIWYEQGNEIFRKNNWGKLFPGASIDVYEWVKSDLLPSEWAAQADTTKGLINSISGQPKYVNNNAISIKQIFNNITGSFENVYYFWVKNKVTLPNVKNRRLSGYQVASYIADPVSNGLKFIEILSPTAIAFANVQPLLIDNRINANITTDDRSEIPRHTEWLLLNENDPTSVPNTLLEKKLFDSLLGHDSLGNPVPAISLTNRNKYGISIRPQQTLFKNRIEALRNLVFFVNSVFVKNRIIDNTRNFDNLNKKEEIPVELSYEYDLLVEDLESLSEIVTTKYQQAEVICYAENGKLKSAIITNPGFGYVIPPKITVITDSESPAEFLTEIDNQGKLSAIIIINAGNGYLNGAVQAIVRPHTAIVRINSESMNKWTKHIFEYTKKVWVKVHTQAYNTTLFWEKIDWQAAEFNKFKAIDYTVSDLFVLASNPAKKVGDYLKIKNIGDGSYGILERVATGGNFSSLYNIVYKENGTIQLLDTLWDYNLGKYAYDKSEIDETLYDQIPDLEINYILIALRDDIFINELKINWNLLFFVAVKYALTEHKLLDWAFKTSFINVTNNVGALNQQPVYQLNNELYFENYVNEIKPYRTKIRSYSSEYTSVDNANLSVTDFDFPSFYNEQNNSFELVSTTGTGLISTTPWKDWKNNYKLHVASIEVGFAGSGYTTAYGSGINVVFVNAPGDTGSGAEAIAYIKNGSIHNVIVTNPGSGYLTAPRAYLIGGGYDGDWWINDEPDLDPDPPDEVGRLSVIMANELVRSTTIGMKFDRISTTGDLTDLNADDEFVCDGATNKFIFSWLPSPDKTTIVPLLDGKLIFEADYTIEYYQVNTENTNNNAATLRIFPEHTPPKTAIEEMFPVNSWEGERPVDHRYRYYTTTINGASNPVYIKHYARFVFLNQTPEYNQVFKISYTKNIKLYNAVDRIFALYNPTDSMPGDELAILMSGIEYPEVSVQGIKFNQAPNWDSTGTVYDIAPWSDAVSNYQIFEISNPMPKGVQGATYKITKYNPILNSFVTTLPAYDVVRGMQISVVGSKPNEYFKTNTTVEEVGPFGLSFKTSTGENFNPVKVYATGTARGSVMVIELSQTITENIVPGDVITLYGVNALYGNSVGYISLRTEFTTTGVVTITLPAPYFNVGVGAKQASFSVVKTGNTATSFSPLDNGMGYSFVQTFESRSVGWGLGYANSGLFTANRISGQSTGGGITITSTAPIYWSDPKIIPDTNPVEYYPDAIAYLDSSFSQSGLIVTSVDGNKIYTTTNIRLSSTGTAMYPDLYRNPDGTLSNVRYTPYALGEAQYTGIPIWKTGLQVGSVIKEIPANGRLLEYVNTITVASTASISVDTGVFYGDAMEAKISLSGYFRDIPTTSAPGGNILSGGSLNFSSYPLPPNDGTIVYKITPSTDGKRRAIVTIYSIDTSTQMVVGNLQVSVYGATQLEVWLPNPGTNGLLDSLINSIYNYKNLTDSNALGYQPSDIVIDGNNFLNPIDSYAPEECVPGYVNDVVGINVYTAGIPSSPVVMSGLIGVPANGLLPTRARIDLLADNSAGLLVYSNGIKFERVPTENFTTITQYSIIGDEIVIPVQPIDIRVGYSFVIVGSDVTMDSNYMVQFGDTDANYLTYGNIVVESVMSIDDVRSVYVLVNDTNINQASTDGPTEYGYRLKAMSSTNKRASVHIQGTNPRAIHTVQVWFFNKLFANFNRVHEQAFVVTATTSTLILDSIPGYAQPVSDKVIVEIISPTRRARLLPPWVTYHKIINGQTTFAIDPINTRPAFYNLDNVKAYINGQELRPGYDFLVDATAQTIVLILPEVSRVNGAAIAIMPLVDYEYIIYNNKLTLTSAINTGTVRVTSFDDHDNMMIRTERFTMNYSRYFTLSSPIISDNYLWITLNDKWLIAGYDFKVLEDARTIEFSEFIEPGQNASVIVTIVNPPSYGTTILGYRQFYDMFGIQHFARLSTYFSTRLAQPLQYTDKQIFLEDGDHLFQPNPTLRLPGVILLDGERIEYTAKDGNVLSGLRRGTLGTGPAKFSDVFTTVIDQSITQKINTYERIYVQFIDSSNTNTYVISTLTNTLTDYTVDGANDYGTISLPSSVYHLSHGISLLTTSTMINPPAAIDQVEVYYGGRKLRKTSLEVHDISKSYYSSEQSITVIPPEFTITTATQTLILNINETITTGTRISVLQRLGKLWEENTSTSLLSNTGSRSVFISEKPAQLPDIYYYGGDKVLYTNGVALTDETGENLEGY